MNKTATALILLLMTACNNEKPSTSKTIGTIERMDASMDALISSDASIEIIAEGHEWTEGPLWVESEKMLLYSDIPPNKILNGRKRKVRNYTCRLLAIRVQYPARASPAQMG